ncbi:MAG TPA: SRPBCC family protein [Candidatus Peribacteria bacterium]|nr:SRPBCC family protein [Candidatus Peribacteria bacterium]
MPASDTSDREIIITRLVNAPRTLVWKAWTQPEHLEKWWGPNGFSVTTRSIQMREGGLWDFVMHGPDGRDYENRIIFTEITEPERIAHDHGDGEGKIHFQATITFEAQGEKTLITMRSVFPTAEELAYVVKEHGAVEGGKQTLGRMAAYAEAM